MSIVLIGSTSGSCTLQEQAIAGTTTLTLPTTSGNVVVDSATQTLTNKTIQGGTITSGTAVASTSGTSIDFTSIPSWVKRITVMFDGVSTNGSSVVQVQIGDSGGIETTGYSGTIATPGFTSNLSTSFPTTDNGSGTAAYVRHGVIVMAYMGSNLWAASINIGISNAAAAWYGGGTKTLSATLDRLRITTANGTDTFDAGTINILYEG
jgi:hypothetical protein